MTNKEMRKWFYNVVRYNRAWRVETIEEAENLAIKENPAFAKFKTPVDELSPNERISNPALI